VILKQSQKSKIEMGEKIRVKTRAKSRLRKNSKFPKNNFIRPFQQLEIDIYQQPENGVYES
jgi:hypothetical protein